ncbi:MAG: glycerol 3-phosphate permease [Pseudomonadota bacterium]|jgi:OPA family glycerol-3-phosphate transporter-like MFS transporter
MFLKSLQQFLPILILVVVIGFVLGRLPRVDLGHSPQFLKRRRLNWLPLGLTYAFLYMGRYNLTVAKNALGDLITNADFGTIFGVGTWVYGLAFVINGPLADRWGGRRTILISAIGSAFANLAMGLAVYLQVQNIVPTLVLCYAVNMYFQSFGAVSIVKVNAAWFHLRERGTFGGIFGILISLGIYFAFDIGGLIVKNAATHWVFFVPVVLLLVFALIDYLLVFDAPEDAGLKEFDTGDVATEASAVRLGAWDVAKRMLRDPVIVTIALIEFCSGFLRNAVMQWYLIFSKQTGQMTHFVAANWGLANCVAGILGGVFAGTISDKIFHSRRGPVSSILYAMLLVGGLISVAVLTSPALGWVVSFMMLAVIGVHGMLSGTASMDFAGKKNVGVAVGLIDGMVYLGTGLQAVVYGSILPSGELAKDPAQWRNWPLAMLPFAAIGLYLATRLWNARPVPKKSQMPHFEATDSSGSSEPARS